MLLVLGGAVMALPSAASAQEVTIVINVEKSVDADYYTPGDPITYQYVVTGNAGFQLVELDDDTCTGTIMPVLGPDNIHNIGDDGGDSGNASFVNNGVLNGAAHEAWQYTCTMPAPSSMSPTLTNEVEVAGTTVGGRFAEDTDTYTLYGLTFRKQVGLYNNGAYPDFNGFPDNTTFTMKMYKCAGNPLVCVYKTTFTISEQSPKYFWFTSGTWKFVEVNLPQGYVPVDWMKNGMLWATGQTPADNDQTFLNVTWSGCSLGHWKNTEVWPYPYQHSTLLEPPFDDLVSALAGDTFIEALKYGGGPGVQGGQMILLRQAVAALLNETVYGSAFGPYLTTDDLIDAVNEALESGNKTTMTTLAGTLDWWNNGICRDVTATSTECPTIAGTYNTNFELTRPPEICEIPSDVTIYGDITAPGILLKVGGEVHGNITQTGFNGLWILAGGTVHGDLDEYGGQLVDIAGTVNGDVTEHDQGALNVQSTGVINGNATEYGDGDLHIFLGGVVTGTATENDNGNLINDNP
jgi:hypothetical protein